MFIFAKSNDDKGKRDASAVFIPEARALADIFSQEPPVLIDTKNTPYPGEHVFDLLEEVYMQGGEIDSINIFCHGWRKGVQLLPKGKEGAKRVAALLHMCDVRMLNLFCCSAAKQSLLGNYCKWVSEECNRIGHRAQIFGHETAGHATRNPMVHVYWPESHAGLRTDAENFTGFKAAMQTSLEYRLTLPFRLIESGLND